MFKNEICSQSNIFFELKKLYKKHFINKVRDLLASKNNNTQ